MKWKNKVRTEAERERERWHMVVGQAVLAEGWFRSMYQSPDPVHRRLAAAMVLAVADAVTTPKRKV